MRRSSRDGEADFLDRDASRRRDGRLCTWLADESTTGRIQQLIPR
jgi:hypothetical protein